MSDLFSFLKQSKTRITRPLVLLPLANLQRWLTRLKSIQLRWLFATLNTMKLQVIYQNFRGNHVLVIAFGATTRILEYNASSPINSALSPENTKLVWFSE